MLEKKVIRSIGDDYFGYEHYEIEFQFKQVFHEIKIKPVTIGIMYVKWNSLSFIFSISRFKIELMINI